MGTETITEPQYRCTGCGKHLVLDQTQHGSHVKYAENGPVECGHILPVVQVKVDRSKGKRNYVCVDCALIRGDVSPNYRALGRGRREKIHDMMHHLGRHIEAGHEIPESVHELMYWEYPK